MIPLNLTLQQMMFLLIVAGALWIFISGRIRVDVGAMLIVIALVVTGILSPDQALSGFASEPALIVASAFVLSAGINATGLTERIGTAIGHGAGGSEWRAVLVVMPAVALMAAFTHHLMITAMMMPILMRLAREKKMAVSRLLMPMSLAASLGTTLTLFSAPAFLLADTLLKNEGRPGLGIFGISPVGMALVLLGIVYMLAVHWLLPRRGESTGEAEYLALDRYYTELLLEPDSPWVGRSVESFEMKFEGRFQIVDRRRDTGLRYRESDEPFNAGDVLLVRATPDEFASIASEPGLVLHAVAKYGELGAPRRGADTAAPRMVQVVIAPRSPFIGRTIGEIDVLRTMRVVVVGLWRKDAWLSDKIAHVRLQEGDVLVLWGRPENYAEIAVNPGFLMMVPFNARELRRHRAPLALGILVAVVTLAATGTLPAHIAFLAGAVAMVVTRCVGYEQAYHEIDVRIYVMIAGVIPLGAAMQQTGTADLLAGHLSGLTAGWTPFTTLLVMFWAGALLTQILSDAATTVLLAPIALAMAQGMGLAPEPFVVCTALGAVAAFLTPLGHHGNLLIFNAGQYRFGDFLRVGIPLTVGISLISVWMARWLWLGGPLLPW